MLCVLIHTAYFLPLLLQRSVFTTPVREREILHTHERSLDAHSQPAASMRSDMRQVLEYATLVMCHRALRHAQESAQRGPETASDMRELRPPIPGSMGDPGLRMPPRFVPAWCCCWSGGVVTSKLHKPCRSCGGDTCAHDADPDATPGRVSLCSVQSVMSYLLTPSKRQAKTVTHMLVGVLHAATGHAARKLLARAYR